MIKIYACNFFMELDSLWFLRLCIKHMIKFEALNSLKFLFRLFLSSTKSSIQTQSKRISFFITSLCFSPLKTHFKQMVRFFFSLYFLVSQQTQFTVSYSDYHTPISICCATLSHVSFISFTIPIF